MIKLTIVRLELQSCLINNNCVFRSYDYVKFVKVVGSHFEPCGPASLILHVTPAHAYYIRGSDLILVTI